MNEMQEFMRQLASAAAGETLPRFRQLSAVVNKLGSGFDPVTDVSRTPGAIHPVARRNWETGRDALFLGRLAESAQPNGAGDVDCVSGCVFLIRRAVLAETGGFDERFFMYFEEADFCERVRGAGHRVRFLPETAFVHEGGLSAAQSAERTFVAFRESTLLYHAAWHGRLMTEWVRLCLLLGVTLRLCAWSVLAALGRRNRAGLYGSAFGMLVRPGLVGALCRRPREVPAIGKEPVS